jgi:peptidoglycan/xylan/chitin deacetylase (PgdA/CDA1 family)
MLLAVALLAGCRGPQATPTGGVPAGRAAARPVDPVARLLAEGKDEYRAGQYVKAVASLGRVVTRHPKSADGWLWLGASCEALGSREDAGLFYRTALGLDRHSEFARKGVLRVGPVKRIAITIDDGPSMTYVLKAMDAAEQYGGRVTFFVTGRWLVRDPQIIRHIARRGHQIGDHTYDHKDLSKLPEDKIRWELGHTSDIIVQQGGPRPTFFRPPYGGHNALVDRIGGEMGMKVAMWDIDPTDWQAGKPGSATVSYVLSHARPNAVVLMHEVHGTYTVLDQIFGGLAKMGYTCVRLDELPRYPTKLGARRG